MLRSLLLAEASRRFELMKDQGILGTLSPAPSEFITQTVLWTKQNSSSDSSSERNERNNLNISRSSIVIDLGCGDGRWLKAIRDLYGCLCIGVELDKERISLAAADDSVVLSPATTNTMRRLEFISANMFDIDLHLATHVIIYLSIEGNKKILKKLERELERGTIILSCGFQMPGLIPMDTYRSHGLVAYKYVWYIED